ncbi:MAG: hypothetical protein JXR59_04005 [Desulfuromonadaceae bacterium]|nr:hypothetical protein [Desulfuromonadaceae bacterium]
MNSHIARLGTVELVQPPEPDIDDSWMADVKPWPELDPSAFHGLAGEFVRLACANSEADPAAVLVQYLARFGAEVGNGCWVSVGETRHYARLFVAIVGDTAKARKGTSAGPVNRVFKLGALDHVAPARTSPGPLSSGEGVVYAVRDETREWDKKQQAHVVTDPGAEDKRLFVLDEEIAALLEAARRDGNTVSAVIRRLWDDGSVEPLTKSSRIRCTGAHVVAVGHIVADELLNLLTSSDVFNGFANRFLFCCARRQRLVPFPEPIPDADLRAHQEKLLYAIRTALATQGAVQLTDAARELWASNYEALTQPHRGRLGAVTNRAEAQTLRLALHYALLDTSDIIDTHHLNAALVVWRYCDASAAWIFGDLAADPDEQRIIDALMERGEMSLNQVRESVFSGHKPKEELQRLVTTMVEENKIVQEVLKTKGRPKTIFSLPGAKSVKSAERSLNTLNALNAQPEEIF